MSREENKAQVMSYKSGISWQCMPPIGIQNTVTYNNLEKIDMNNTNFHYYFKNNNNL